MCPPTQGPRGLLSPALADGRAVLEMVGCRAGGMSAAPAKLSLKRCPVAPTAFYGHTTLNAPHLV